MKDGPIKELTFEERAIWGECAICGAKHGERCRGEVGIALGQNVRWQPPADGAHLARLNAAPHRVQLVPLKD